MTFAPPSPSAIRQLTAQGCSALRWESVYFSSGCDLSRIVNVMFIGTVQIGGNKNTVSVEGVELPCGIYRAIIADCTIGENVRIANIGSTIVNYRIDDNAVVENVASLCAESGSSFGNGTELDVVNEGGGRGTKIFNQMNAQTAYLQAAMKHNAAFVKNLSALIAAEMADRPSRAVIHTSARLLHCGRISNVSVGPHAYLHGVQLLENGTILSCAEHPAEVGENVIARSFIIAEGATIDGGAVLDKVFAGQGVKLGKQFSAENSLFFANCEGFHGEAVSLFAGPYTVSHHKSSLMIAGFFSFYNAGSGTNQSNHMYKLGPVHQGVFERGCKTGSFSYVLLESHIAPFSVLIGKHYTNINTPDLPFSYIHEEGGASKIIPGMNLFAVGTVRDGEKWPKRDNRKAPVKRDRIIFDVFSPYTVEKMRRGRDLLLSLSAGTPKEKQFVQYGGLQISRLLLRKGAKYYSMAIARYLNDALWRRLSAAMEQYPQWDDAAASLAPVKNLDRPNEWTDLCGLLVPMECLRRLEENVASGTLGTLKELDRELENMYDDYREYEWCYIYDTIKKEYAVEPVHLTKVQALAAAEEWHTNAASLQAMILEDSKKEFAAFAQIGFGIDRTAEERESDFRAVRGSSATNGVVQKLETEASEIEQRYHQFKNSLKTI